jgi:hypothetical protein
MLDQIARHGLIDLDIEAEGDLHIDGHHTVEDVGITLGQAVAQAVGDKKGIRRYGHAYVPLDEALSRVVIDFSGRPGLVMNVPFKSGMIGGFDTQLPTSSSRASSTTPGHPAHRQPAWRQRAPPVRDGVQGLCARAAHGAGAGPALGRRDSVHQGLALTFSGKWHEPCGRRLRHGQPALGVAGGDACGAGQRLDVVITHRPEEVRAAERVVLPGQGAMPDCMRELRDSGLLDAVLQAAANKPLLGVCVGMQMLLDTARSRTPPGWA